MSPTPEPNTMSAAAHKPTPASSGWLLAGLLRRLAAAVLVLLVAAPLALLLWASTPQALGQALGWAQKLLTDPVSGQSALAFEHAEGNLLRGGHIGQLRWRSADGLELVVQALELRWTPTQWWQLWFERSLQLEVLTAQSLTVYDRRAPTDPEPPQSLALPWLQTLATPLHLQRLHWRGRFNFDAGPLRAHYRYGRAPDTAQASPAHHLQVEHLAWVDSQYRAVARLQSSYPLQIELAIDADLSSPATPGVPTQQLQLSARLSGALARADALLVLHGQMQPVVRPRASDALAPELHLEARIRPWAEMPLEQAQLRLHDVDLARFVPLAPQTRLSGQWHIEPGATGTPAGAHWQLRGEMRNLGAGPWDRDRLPLERLQLVLDGQGTRWQIQRLLLTLGAARLQAEGALVLHPAGRPSPWVQRLAGVQAQLRLEAFEPHRVWSRLPATEPLQLRAQANMDARHTLWSLELQAQPGAAARARAGLIWPVPTLRAHGRWADNALLEVHELEASLLQARLQAAFRLHPKGLGATAPRLEGSASLGVPGARWQLQGPWPLNQTPTQLQLHIDDAARLQDWAQSLVVRIDDWQPALALRQRGSALWFGQWQGQADLAWASTAAPDGGGQAQHWQAQGQAHLQHRSTRFGHWQLQAKTTFGGAWNPSGRDPAHAIKWQLGEFALRQASHPLGWQMRLEQAIELRLDPAAAALDLGAGALHLSAVAAPGHAVPVLLQQATRLHWQHIQWQRGWLRSLGGMSGLPLSWIDHWLGNATSNPLQAAGLSGNLRFDADWSVALPLQEPLQARRSASPEPAQARLALRRSSGDLSIDFGPDAAAGRRAQAGVEALELGAELQGQQLQAQLHFDSRLLGQARAQFGTQLLGPQPGAGGWSWAADAPLRGQLQAQLPRLSVWSRLLDALGWRFDGQVGIDARLSGSRAQPDWQGTLELDQFTLRSVIDGIDLSDGQLRARFDGNRLQIDQLQLRGAGGQAGGLLSGHGLAQWTTGADGRNQPSLSLTLQAHRLRLLARADQRLSLSGQLLAQLDHQLLDLSGHLHADEALFLLPDEATPRLGPDVQVRSRRPSPSLAERLPFQTRIGIDLDLGPQFEVRGQGFTGLLRGQVRLETEAGRNQPSLFGQVRTERASLRAFGQRLQIERGILRFNGPFDNPSLDILALRPHLGPQRVGAEVSGSAQAPRLRLYASPDLPEHEKLAWLLLGRPASGAGAQAAMLQQAALAMLHGWGVGADDGVFARLFGLDELVVRGPGVGPDAAPAAITLGKRLSERLHVSYTRSLTGLMGTVAVFLDLSRHLTLRARAGDDNAIDLVFTYAFDRAQPPRTIPGGPP